MPATATGEEHKALRGAAAGPAPGLRRSSRLRELGGLLLVRSRRPREDHPRVLPLARLDREHHHAVARLEPPPLDGARSEEHTSELQSHSDLVCRLLLEKKKK